MERASQLNNESKAMWEVAIVMSGEVVSPREGTWVGESMLKRMRSVFVKDSVIRVPIASARVPTCSVRVPGRVMGIEVSHDDIVIMEVEKKVKSGGPLDT